MPASELKQRTNVSIDRHLLEAARRLELNVSAISESALRSAVRAEEAKRWAEENAQALALREEWIRKQGLPLAPFQALSLS